MKNKRRVTSNVKDGITNNDSLIEKNVENICESIPVSEKGKSNRTNSTSRICEIRDSDQSLPVFFLILRLVVAFVILLLPRFVDVSENVVLAMYILSAVISGYDLLVTAVRNISERIYLWENYLIITAVLCFIAVGRGFEAAASVVLFQTAFILRTVLIRRIKHSYFNSISLPALSKGISVGDSILVNEGSRIPTDCTVIEGRGMVDCSFITGDVSPLQYKPGDFIPAGCLCLSGQMVLEAETLPEAAIVTKMRHTIDTGYKLISNTERKILSFSRYLILLILIFSLILLIILPYSYNISFLEAVIRVATILSICSLCSALISIPMTFLSALISARRAGTVFKDATIMDKTGTVGTVIFDKIGTITNETYKVSDIRTDRMDPATFLKVAAHVASVSEMPVFNAIVVAYGNYINFDIIRNVLEYKGKGISVEIDNIDVLLGTYSFLKENCVQLTQQYNETSVFMSIQGEYAGRIVLMDSVNTNISNYVRELYSAGVDRVVMLSSDSRERDAKVAREAGINEYYAECSNNKKAEKIKDIRSRMPNKSKIAYVSCGDCKDACIAADVSINLRGMEKRYSEENTDIAIMGKSIKSVPDALYRAKSLRKTIYIKISILLLIKTILIILAAGGFLTLFFVLLIDNLAAMAIIFDYSVIIKPESRKGGKKPN